MLTSNENIIDYSFEAPEVPDHIPTYEELSGVSRSRAEIEDLSFRVLTKVEQKGLKALNDEEISHYRYYLTTRAYKLNAKGEATKPIHKAIADLVLLDMNVFILNGDAYIYDTTNGAYIRDPEGKRICKKIRDLLEFEFIEDKTISSIYNLIIKDDTLTIHDSDINKRPKHWIHFKNGYFDYKTESYYPHDPKYNEISVIPWDYAPSRYPCNYKFVKRGKGLLRETVEEPLEFRRWLDHAIPDPEDQKMVLQYIAYSLTLETNAQKFLIVSGSGGTGKSTLLSVVESIIGLNNISSVSLQGLQDRFTPGELYLKQANICADIPLSALSEVDMIKKLTGEDLISADRKFKSNFMFKSFARLFFSANDIPVNLSDKSNAFYRRMLILRMDNKPDHVDPNLVEKLKSEIPNIITLAVDELILSGGVIEESDNSKSAVKEAYKNSDTVEAFLDDRCEFDDKARIDRVELYRIYCNYCDNEERKYVKRSNFYKQLADKGFQSRRSKNNYDICGIKIRNVINMPGVNNYSSAG